MSNAPSSHDGLEVTPLVQRSSGDSGAPVEAACDPDELTVISQRPPSPAASAARQTPPGELGKLLAGERLNHFELREYVGGGGMGAVFRALDTLLNRDVALKVLSRDQGADEETRRRFQNEAQSAARLDHENIARVYYVGEDRGLNYIAFEFIDGPNLRVLVERKGPLPLAEAISYTLQVAEALAHASSRDVVHRDIKPSNVIITGEGRAKLVDMGLARLHQLNPDADELTASGVTLGTFDYISPEQARDPRSADVRSDIYSLGCTLYYMLTGRPPFPDGTVLQKLLQHNSDEPPDPREFSPRLPDEVSLLVRRMLAKDPRRRFQTANELIAELLLLAEQMGCPAPGGRGVVFVSGGTAPVSLLERHLPWMIPVGALLCIVFLMDRAWPTLDGQADPSAVGLAGDTANAAEGQDPRAGPPVLAARQAVANAPPIDPAPDAGGNRRAAGMPSADRPGGRPPARQDPVGQLPMGRNSQDDEPTDGSRQDPSVRSSSAASGNGNSRPGVAGAAGDGSLGQSTPGGNIGNDATARQASGSSGNVAGADPLGDRPAASGAVGGDDSDDSNVADPGRARASTGVAGSAGARATDDSGTDNSGTDNSGIDVSGTDNSATDDSATDDSGTDNSDIDVSGTDNSDSGDRASGDRASGDSASGDSASGDSASGDRASGDSDSGDRASDDRAADDRGAGDRGVGTSTGNGNGTLKQTEGTATTGEASGPRQGQANGAIDIGASASRQVPPRASDDVRQGVLYVSETVRGPQHFSSLEEACAKAGKNDVIELQYSGRLEADPIALANRKLTIRAVDPFKPVIVFRPTDPDPVASPRSMITVAGGSLKLVNVSLELDVPRDLPADSWSLFETQLADSITLEKCVLTVRNASQQRGAYHQEVAFVRVKGAPGVDSMMMSKGMMPLKAVEIVLDDCIARGEAAFLRASDLQPFRLSWHNGLLATTERLLVCEGGTSQGGEESGLGAVELRHVTAVLGRGLCRLSNTSDAPAQLMMHLSCSDSILMLPAEAALVEQSGTSDVKGFQQRLQWNGEWNLYQGFTRFWRIVQTGTNRSPLEWSFAQWSMFWTEAREVQASLAPVLWRKLPDAQRPVHTHRAADYALNSERMDNPARARSSDGLDAGFIAADLPRLADEPAPPSGPRE